MADSISIELSRLTPGACDAFVLESFVCAVPWSSTDACAERKDSLLMTFPSGLLELSLFLAFGYGYYYVPFV